MSADPTPRRVDYVLDPEAILHTVVRYLLAQGQTEAARYLAMATIDVFVDSRTVKATITVEGSPLVFDYLGRLMLTGDVFARGDDEQSERDYTTLYLIRMAFANALPGCMELTQFSRRLFVAEVAEGWRTEILRELDGHAGHNQGVALPDQEILTWRGLRFRSLSEMMIAKALDRAGALFFPNCRARLGQQKRGNLEPDFLVCHKGVWGILEVDGEPFHPPTRTVHDHERDRPFLRHGVKLVQHFDATHCRNDPDGVVAEFLALLER